MSYGNPKSTPEKPDTGPYGRGMPVQGPAPAGWKFRVLLLVLTIIPAGTLVMVFGLYHNVPWGDQIGLFFTNRFDEGLTLEKLFRFSNEHQIVFTKLCMYLD